MSDETIVRLLEEVCCNLPPEMVGKCLQALFRYYDTPPTHNDLRTFLKILADASYQYEFLQNLCDDALAASIVNNDIRIYGYPGNGYIPER